MWERSNGILQGLLRDGGRERKCAAHVPLVPVTRRRRPKDRGCLFHCKGSLLVPFTSRGRRDLQNSKPHHALRHESMKRFPTAVHRNYYVCQGAKQRGHLELHSLFPSPDNDQHHLIET